jgi:hypothetical protein
MKQRNRDEQGIALIIVVFAMVVILGAVTTVVLHVNNAQRETANAIRSTRLDEVCQAGVEIAIAELWQRFLVTNGNTTGNLAAYRAFLNNSDPPIPNNAPNAQQMVFSALVSEDAPREIRQGDGGAVTGRVRNIDIARVDDFTGGDFVIRVTAEVDGMVRSVQQTVRIAGEPFPGFEFAVLANNINCILCHAEFRALDLERNTDANQFGTFDRIKVACLESLLIRPSEARSNVAGTVYTRGDVRDQSGKLLSAANVASSSFKGYGFSSVNGKINQDPASGSMVKESLVNAGVDGDGMLTQFSNLYQNYPSDPSLMTDGPVPVEFPSPFADENGNRNVDDHEFQEYLDLTAGMRGTLTGGVAYGVPEGSIYTESTLPAAGNGALADINDGLYEGNLILVGTEDEPIQINGEVAIDGDLVIKGKVEGWGQLKVRGNVYIVGDVTYDDVAGEFGTNAYGMENGLAIASASSILMGDYLTVRGKSHTEDLSKYPNSAGSIQVRRANNARSMSYNSTTQTVDNGYFSPGAVDAGEIMPTMLDADGNEVPRQGQQFSFTTSELMLFNNMELQKAVADPTYIPRFYGLREDQPNNIYVYDSKDEHSVHYTEQGGSVKLLSTYLVEKGLSLDILDRGTVHYMNPQSNWLSEDVLRQIWWEDEMGRSSSGDPFRFDGLLYSNNAIFAIVKSRTRHGSFTDGKMDIRGAVISPDLGVLIPSNAGSNDIGLTLSYDRRVRRFMRLEDPTRVAFRRLVFSHINTEA